MVVGLNPIIIKLMVTFFNIQLEGLGSSPIKNNDICKRFKVPIITKDKEIKVFSLPHGYYILYPKH